MFDYDALCEIMGDNVADGGQGFAGNDEFQHPPPPPDNALFDEVQSAPLNVEANDERKSTARNAHANPTITLGVPHMGTKRKQTSVDLVDESVVRMADAMDSFATTRLILLEV